MTDTKNLTKDDAKRLINELTEQHQLEQEKKAEKQIKLSDIAVDKTTGKISLPKMTPRGIALIETIGGLYPAERKMGGVEQMAMLVWVLQNQKNSKAFSITADEMDEITTEFLNDITVEDLEAYAEAVEAAVPSIPGDERGKQEGNPTKPRSKRGKAKRGSRS